MRIPLKDSNGETYWQEVEVEEKSQHALLGQSVGWFFISFADPRRPKGTQFLGGCYVDVGGPDPTVEARAMLFATKRRGDGTTLDDDKMPVALALARATALGINPGGEAQITGPIPVEHMDKHVPASKRERLLSREEAEAT